MMLPPEIDFNVPAAVVDCGALPYQAIVLHARQNQGQAAFMSQPLEAQAADYLRLQQSFPQPFAAAAPKPSATGTSGGGSDGHP
jgi:hypothetical protein